MSRAYRIRVRETLKRDLTASDEICSDLELLEILPKEQMGALLEAELKGRGFEEKDGKLTRKGGDVTVEIDAKEGTVSVRSEKGEEVELETNKEGWGYDDEGPRSESVKKRLSDEAKKDLERRAEEKRERLQGQATEKLEKELCDLQGELDGVVNRVTAEALKEKARQMGEIKEISEDTEAGSLTIKVEV